MFHAWLIDYFLRIVEKGAFQGSFSLRRKFLNKICLECDAHKSIRFLELWGGGIIFPLLGYNLDLVSDTQKNFKK